jgi:histidine ammonia-lyase
VVLSDLFRVLAIQMLCVAQAADIETSSARPCSPNMSLIHGFVRRLSAFLSADRPLGSDIDRIASEMQDGCDFPEIMT